jgi:hypothetical protein
MSFSPRNVSQLLATSADASATLTAASAVGAFQLNEVVNAVPAAGGGLYNVNKSINVLVKTTGGFKVSDSIIIDNITSSKTSVITAGVDKKVVLTVPTVAASTTYSITVDVHDGIGSMLNDRFISAYVVLDASTNFLSAAGVVTAGTATSVATELYTILTSTFKQTGAEFTAANGTATKVDITQVAQVQKVGANDGIAFPVDITGKATGDVSLGGVYSNVPFVTVITEGKPGDLDQLKNIEWFNSGYDKDPYRNIGWPASFDADSNLVATGAVDTDEVLIIQYYKDRDATNVERQHRQLILVGSPTAIGVFEAAIGTAIVLDA